MAEDTVWWYKKEEGAGKVGPVATAGLKPLIANGDIDGMTLFSSSGDELGIDTWEPASSIAMLRALFQSVHDGASYPSPVPSSLLPRLTSKRDCCVQMTRTKRSRRGSRVPSPADKMRNSRRGGRLRRRPTDAYTTSMSPRVCRVGPCQDVWKRMEPK